MHGEVDNYEEGAVSDLEELERRFGTVAGPGRTDISGYRDVSRWTDNPFTPPNASPELLEWYDKRDEAIRIWRETGDDSMAIEIGLFPSKEEEMAEEEAQLSALRRSKAPGKRTECYEGARESGKQRGAMTLDRGIYEHGGRQFEVTRTSPDSVTIALVCDDHDHEEYIVGRIEEDTGWGVGRRESGEPFDGDSFLEAVEYSATMLSEECVSLDAIEQVDDFFESEVIPPLKDRLDALAGFLLKFESPDFEFGQMVARPGEMPFYSFSDDAMRFIEVCYEFKWVRPFDWGEWMGSEEATRLRDDPTAIETATPDQLQRLLTVLIRQERFVDGVLGSAFESGLMMRVLRRATVLAQDSEVTGADDLEFLESDRSGDSGTCDGVEGIASPQNQEAPRLSTTNTPNRPIPNSYWVKPGRFAAGEYPGAIDRDEAATTLRALLGSGVDHFIDLTETRDGLEPYAQIAEEEARSLGKTVVRDNHPITDLSVPQTPGQMVSILDAIDNALDNDRTVYVHCWGGIGRTGTVIGCWLVRHGCTGEEALAQVAEWWMGMAKASPYRSSPETCEQRQYVLGWGESMDREVSA